MSVFVLDKHKQPLMPCSEKRVRLLLARARAVVHRMAPFTIRLKDRVLADSTVQPVRLCIEPGSKTTGIALVRERETVDRDSGEVHRERCVLNLFDLFHRGQAIRKAMEQRRTFHRAPTANTPVFTGAGG